jgi:hypothetical protein
MRKRFIVPAILALAVALGLGSCVLQAGYAYGKIDWTTGYTLYVNSDFYSTSGFPYPAYKANYYQLSSGSYYFYYSMQSGSGSYPSTSSGPLFYYNVSYSIEPNYGPVGSHVADSFMDIFCYSDNSSITQGWSRGILSGVKPDGVPVTIQKGAYKMTISVKQVELTDAEKASFIPLGAKSE